MPFGVVGGKSPGTDDGNGDGRGAIGVTSGPGAVTGRGEVGTRRDVVDGRRALARRAVFAVAVRLVVVFLALLRADFLADFLVARADRAEVARFFVVRPPDRAVVLRANFLADFLTDFLALADFALALRLVAILIPWLCPRLPSALSR